MHRFYRCRIKKDLEKLSRMKDFLIQELLPSINYHEISKAHQIYVQIVKNKFRLRLGEKEDTFLSPPLGT